MEKRRIRQEMLERLKEQDDTSRRRKSDAIALRLFDSEEFKRARMIMFYASFDYEVETVKMMDKALGEGKQICLPIISVGDKNLMPSQIKTIHNGFVKGPYSVIQPRAIVKNAVALNKIDLVVVPGIAFDHCGHRLGHGKGYYDRFLSQLPEGTPSVGLAFDFQILEHLPVLPHDRPVHKILSA